MLVGVSLQRARASRIGAHLEFECLAAIASRVAGRRVGPPARSRLWLRDRQQQQRRHRQLKPVPQRSRSRPSCRATTTILLSVSVTFFIFFHKFYTFLILTECFTLFE